MTEDVKAKTCQLCSYISVLIVLQKNWDEDIQSFVPFDERLQSKTCLTREVRSVSNVHLEPRSLTLRPKSMVRKKTEVEDSLRGMY